MACVPVSRKPNFPVQKTADTAPQGTTSTRKPVRNVEESARKSTAFLASNVNSSETTETLLVHIKTEPIEPTNENTEVENMENLEAVKIETLGN